MLLCSTSSGVLISYFGYPTSNAYRVLIEFLSYTYRMLIECLGYAYRMLICLSYAYHYMIILCIHYAYRMFIVSISMPIIYLSSAYCKYLHAYHMLIVCGV